MIRVFLIVLFIVFTISVSQAQETLTPAETGKLLDYLKADNVPAALEFVRDKKKSNPSSKKLQLAENLLDDASRRSEGDYQKIVLRGDTARIFELYTPAFELYKQALDVLEQYFQKTGNRISDFYMAAYKAAICAFWTKDYDSSFAMLALIETNGQTWVKELGQKKAALLKGFLADRDNISNRIKFARDFWIANVPAVGLQGEDVFHFLEESLTKNPTQEEKKEIYVLLRDTALAANDAERAEKYLDLMIGEFPQDDITAQTVFSVSQAYFKERKYTESQKWLNWIIRNNQSTGKYVPLAYVGLSEVSEKLGDEAAMIKYLQIAAQDPNVTATGRGIMDTSDTRQTALIRLGQYYKTKGSYEEALKYFAEWKPRSFCGNCSAQMKYEKDLYIAECLIGLGREAEALDKYLLPNLKIDGGGLYADAKIPRLVVNLYEKRNQLEDFLSEIKPHAQSQYNHTAQIAEKLAQVKVWAKNQEIEKLVSEIKHRGGYVPDITSDFIRESNWLVMAIAEELAKMNGREFSFLKKRYDGLAASNAESAYGDRGWVIYALGVSKSKDSEDFLRELLQKAKTTGNIGVRVESINFALALKK